MHAMPGSRSWSRTYTVQLGTGDIVHLKGTPRSRPEAVTTPFLYTCSRFVLLTRASTDLRRVLAPDHERIGRVDP